MNLTIHRGTKEIGGSFVELSAGGTRIIIDVGMPLVAPGGGELDMNDLAELSRDELIQRKILPNITGLYDGEEASVDAVIISHAHQDHYGLLKYIHPDIPVYMGEGTHKLIEITESFTPQVFNLRNPVLFKWPGTFEVGPFTITPHLVDHSAFGAFAFEIASAGKRLFYSGDFREHGYLGKTLDIIQDKCKTGVDALVMEGTMFGRTDDTVLTEEELAEQAAEICRACAKAVLVWQSGQNVSRAVSFYKAARRSGRLFVIDFYMAHVLTELGKTRGGEKLPYPGNLPDVRVWYPKYLTDRVYKDGKQDIAIRYSNWKMTKEEMAEDLSKVLLFTRPGMETDIKRINGIEDSILLYSLWEGYLKTERTKKFINSLASIGINHQTLHTSGHATVSTLQRLVDILEPKTIIPIHTFHPECFNELGDNITFLDDGQIYNV